MKGAPRKIQKATGPNSVFIAFVNKNDFTLKVLTGIMHKKTTALTGWYSSERKLPDYAQTLIELVDWYVDTHDGALPTPESSPLATIYKLTAAFYNKEGSLPIIDDYLEGDVKFLFNLVKGIDKQSGMLPSL